MPFHDLISANISCDCYSDSLCSLHLSNGRTCRCKNTLCSEAVTLGIDLMFNFNCVASTFTAQCPDAVLRSNQCEHPCDRKRRYSLAVAPAPSAQFMWSWLSGRGRNARLTARHPTRTLTPSSAGRSHQLQRASTISLSASLANLLVTDLLEVLLKVKKTRFSGLNHRVSVRNYIAFLGVKHFFR